MAVRRQNQQAAQAAMMRRAAMQRAAPAIPAGRPATKQLTSDDFTSRVQVPNSMSSVAAYRVPRNSVLELRNNVPFRMRLFGQLTGAIADTDATTAFDIDASALRPVRSPSPAPALPAVGHPDVRVYLSTDSGVNWTEATVNAVDFGTGVITIAKLASTAYQYKAYVLPAVGTFQIVSEVPAGVDSTTKVVYNDTLAALHEVNQAEGETAPRLMNPSGDNVSLAGNFALVLQVESAASIVWDAEAPHQVYFDAKIVQVIVRDRAALNKAVEQGMF